MLSRGSLRQTIDKSVLVVGAIVFLLLVLALIYLAYQFKWDWTGFNERIGPNVPQYQPSKTIWDWLQLLGVLAIPVVVGFGTLWFTAKHGQISGKTNKDNQREM